MTDMYNRKKERENTYTCKHISGDSG